MYNFYIWAYGKDIVRLFLYTSSFSRATCSQLDGLDRERAVGLTVIPSARCEFHHPAARPWTPGGTGQARLTRPTQVEQPPRHGLAGVGRNKGLAVIREIFSCHASECIVGRRWSPCYARWGTGRGYRKFPFSLQRKIYKLITEQIQVLQAPSHRIISITVL